MKWNEIILTKNYGQKDPKNEKCIGLKSDSGNVGERAGAVGRNSMKAKHIKIDFQTFGNVVTWSCAAVCVCVIPFVFEIIVIIVVVVVNVIVENLPSLFLIFRKQAAIMTRPDCWVSAYS